jgi:hypothetical protein
VGKASVISVLKSKSVLATALITPLVIAGMGLLAFQTYSFITGKSFKDFNLEIGKLWNFKKQTEERTTPPSNREMAYPIKPKNSERLETKEERVFQKLEKLPRPKVAKSILQEEKVKAAKAVVPPQPQILLNNINEVVFSRFNNTLVSSYVKRLDNNYLINPKINPHFGTWFISASFSPTLNYRNLNYYHHNIKGAAFDQNTLFHYGLTEAQRNATDQTISGFSIALEAGKRMGKRLSVYTGLRYTGMGEQVLLAEKNAQAPRLQFSSFHQKLPMYEAAEVQEQNVIPYTNQYNYWQVPLGIHFDVYSRKLTTVAAQAEISYHRLNRVNAMVYDFNTDYYYWFDDEEGLFNVNGFGTQVGVIVSQFATPRTEFFAHPFFNYNLTKTHTSAYPVDQHQYATGLRIGMRHHLH